MLRSIEKYFAVFKINLQDYFSYKFEFFGRFIFLAIILFIFAQLWKIGLSNSGKTMLAGYNIISLIWYIAVAEILLLATGKIYDEIDVEIKSGSIAYLLNKPMNYILFNFSKFLAQTLPALAMNMIVGFPIAFFFVGPINFTIGAFFYLAITGFFCFALIFLLSFLMGLFAFWTEDVRAFGFVYQKALFVFGGLVIPLEMFPPALRTIADLLPFKYTLYATANLFVFPSIDKFFAVVQMQLLWLIIMAAIVWIVFELARKKISINGG